MVPLTTPFLPYFCFYFFPLEWMNAWLFFLVFFEVLLSQSLLFDPNRYLKKKKPIAKVFNCEMMLSSLE